jgi:hypothetical protein
MRTARATHPPARPRSSPSAISLEAREHFAAGVALLQDPDGEKIEEAYREFRTAFEMSGSAKILGNIGLCAMKLERDGEAIEAYARYLREVPNIDADERAQIVRDLQTLTVGVARLAISTDKPGVRLVDVRVPVRGERITNVYGPVDGKTSIGLRPGHHVITARLAGYDEATWEVEAYAGGRDEHAFAMRKTVVAAPAGPAVERPTPSVAPWVVMGGGGAMLAAGAISGPPLHADDAKRPGGRLLGRRSPERRHRGETEEPALLGAVRRGAMATAWSAFAVGQAA